MAIFLGFHPFLTWNDRYFELASAKPAILRRDPPPTPLDLSFCPFLTFLHHCLEEVERHLLWKLHNKIQRKNWSNKPPKLLSCLRFLIYYTKLHRKSAVSESSIALGRLAGPPLIWNFVHFWLSLHYGIEEVERHLLWKFHIRIQRKSGSNVPPKLLACIRFIYKVVHKIGRLGKFNRSREI